jgi:hypothetical protein
MKDYKIIIEKCFNCATDEQILESLENSVNIYLGLGYIPIGTPLKINDGFCQAIYRDDKDI